MLFYLNKKRETRMTDEWKINRVDITRRAKPRFNIQCNPLTWSRYGMDVVYRGNKIERECKREETCKREHDGQRTQWKKQGKAKARESSKKASNTAQTTIYNTHTKAYNIITAANKRENIQIRSDQKHTANTTILSCLLTTVEQHQQQQSIYLNNK